MDLPQVVDSLHVREKHTNYVGSPRLKQPLQVSGTSKHRVVLETSGQLQRPAFAPKRGSRKSMSAAGSRLPRLSVGEQQVVETKRTVGQILGIVDS